MLSCVMSGLMAAGVRTWSGMSGASGSMDRPRWHHGAVFAIDSDYGPPHAVLRALSGGQGMSDEYRNFLQYLNLSDNLIEQY
jgi:hypothetical protein